jgi:hypothetical protein
MRAHILLKAAEISNRFDHHASGTTDPYMHFRGHRHETKKIVPALWASLLTSP